MSTAYQESEDHVPNPLYMSGIVDTTGTTGGEGARIEQISPVFAQHRAAALDAAVAEVDNDPNQVGSGSKVVLPDSDLSRDEAIQNLRDAAQEAKDSPQLTDGLTPGQVEAAQEGEPVNPNSPEAAEGADESDGGEVNVNDQPTSEAEISGAPVE